MGWTVTIQLVRDRALDRAELTRLRAHVRSSGLARDGYGFAVAPAGGAGVIAIAGGKLARSPDPEHDEAAARLFAALTELHGLFDGARLELADDWHLIGWDGEAVTLVQDPDQELTDPPADRTGWLAVPAPRKAPAKPRAKKAVASGLSPALDEALAAVRAGGQPGDLSGVGPDEATALLRAIAKAARGKTTDHDLRAALRGVAKHVAARTIVDAALATITLMDTDAATAVADAMERMPDRAVVREAAIAAWRSPPPADAERRWDAIGWALLLPLAHDPWVIAQLGDEHDAADRDERSTWRRNYNVERVLAVSPDGVKRLVRRRRRDRATLQRPLTPGLLSYLAGERFEVAVPTLLLELASFTDRDEVTLALARYGEARFLPVLQRMLATDQYTRIVAEALQSIPGDEAAAMQAGLAEHDDPLVRIRAAQGLVMRRGAEAAPALIDAVRSARAMGIWRYRHPPGTWSNEQLRAPADGLAPPFRHRGTWPELGGVDLGAEPEGPVAAATVERMLSRNPDIRRDAIELTHEAAIAARDGRGALTLARAERLHRALCDVARVPMTTGAGSCSRVNVTGYWSSPVWRKVAKIPFDPAYKYDHVTWNWLEAHVREHVEQVVAAPFADLGDDDAARARATASGVRPLTFARSEGEAWDAREAAVAAVDGA